MPSKKKPVNVAVSTGEQPEAITSPVMGDEAPVVPSVFGDHVDIYRGETFVRTYSLADQGENFADLADQYVAGHPDCHKQ